MKFFARVAGLLLSATMIVSAPAEAHHSASAYYDVKKNVTISGKIAHVDWRNPHVFFYVDAPDRSGHVARWTLETQSPIALESLGLHKTDVKPGDPVIVDVMPAIVSPNRGRIRVLKYKGRAFVDMGKIGLKD